MEVYGKKFLIGLVTYLVERYKMANLRKHYKSSKKTQEPNYLKNWAYKPLGWLCILVGIIFIFKNFLISIILFLLASYLFYMYKIKKNIYWVNKHEGR